MPTHITIATDNFHRPDADSLGGFWTEAGFTAYVIQSNLAVQTYGGNDQELIAYWIGPGTFIDNQYSMSTYFDDSGGGVNPNNPFTYVGTSLQNSPSQGYVFIINLQAGNAAIAKTTGGGSFGTNLVSGTLALPAHGDVYELDLFNGVLTAFVNGVQALQVTDPSPLTGGTPGLALYNTTAITFSNWEGGNLVASGSSISGNAGVAGATVSWSGTSSGSTTAAGDGSYTIPSLANGSYTITPSLAGHSFSPTSRNVTVSGSNITGVDFTAFSATAYSVPDCRDTSIWPNSAVNVQGTLTYTVPSHPSRTPPVDSRVHKPVDSRKSPNIPINSRTFPPFES